MVWAGWACARVGLRVQRAMGCGPCLKVVYLGEVAVRAWAVELSGSKEGERPFLWLLDVLALCFLLQVPVESRTKATIVLALAA